MPFTRLSVIVSWCIGTPLQHAAAGLYVLFGTRCGWVHTCCCFWKGCWHETTQLRRCSPSLTVTPA